MIKGYKIRIYPTKEQEQLIYKHIGCCRFIWNYMVAYQEENHRNGGKYLSAYDMIRLLTPLKNDSEHDWLYEVSSASLQNICKDVNEAYQRMFKKQNKHPKFKTKKRTKMTYPARSEKFYFVDDGCVQIEKLGRVKYKTDFNLPQGRNHKFSNVRISNKNDKWMLSFGMECENQTPVLTDKNMGIDLGVKDLAIVAFDDIQLAYHNINKSKKMKQYQKKLIHLQRSISRKYEANKDGNKCVKTNNIMKQEAKLRKLYARMSNIRHNYIHQTTHELVSKLPCRVVMEDLNVTGMMKNKHLAKAIQEQCFYEFIKQMKYKCEWNGIEFIQVDRFYPSSKTCSRCGEVKKDLKLSDRTYVCEHCGLVIDRDYNAAINLSKYTT